MLRSLTVNQLVEMIELLKEELRDTVMERDEFRRQLDKLTLRQEARFVATGSDPYVLRVQKRLKKVA